MRTLAVVLAAGQGSRFGGDKTSITLRGKPLWRYSYDTFRAHPGIDGVGVITSAGNIDAIRPLAEGAAFVELGGATRTESSRRAVAYGECERILIHDAARPFVSTELIDRVLSALDRHPAAAPAIPVTDTIRRLGDGAAETLERSRLVAMQTPQGVVHSVLAKAYSESTGEFTDEMALLESVGIQPEFVPGEDRNFKVTSPDDLARAAAVLGAPEVRTGIGYDIHPFSGDSSRQLVLGGVPFEGPGLEGHSDADVLLHAVTDALLGAAGLGDIGQHFPNQDPQWRNADSTQFLRFGAGLLREQGWQVVNVDATVIAEFPKIMGRALEIRGAIAEALEIDPSRVSVKATTNERLGSIGRGEGIASFATATIRQFP